jgi:hypothetical protein
MSVTKEDIYKAGEKYVGYKSGYYTTEHLQSINDFKAGAEWMAEKMYSEEEVYNLLEMAMKDCYHHDLDEHYSGDFRNLKDWFPRFKKK